MGKNVDCIVVGGGLVGTACTYGLLQQGLSVAQLDEGDLAFRASRGNFGLIWVQGKGAGLPEYARWSLASSKLWPTLAATLQQETGIDVALTQQGGYHFCLTEAEMDERAAILTSLQQAVGPDYQFELLNQSELRARLPAIGPNVYGATYSPMDGHVNPLRLLHALHRACRQRGSTYRSNSTVQSLEYSQGCHRVQHGDTTWVAPRIVLAAGLGNRALAPQVGLHAPVSPNQGQVLVSERIEPFLTHPTIYVRQTDEGTIQIGDSMQDVGFDDTTQTDILARIAQRAITCFPALANLNVIRTWAALRIMTPDGFPIYQASDSHPGACVVTCHSGVTLAANHALHLAPWLAGGPPPAELHAFTGDRFLAVSQESHHGP